jgi:signal transduction histidine kinase
MLHGLVGAFAAVAFAFILSSVATFYASREIDSAGQDLLENALPSVTELMHARSALRQLDAYVDILGSAPAARIELLDALSSARVDLGENLRLAMGTPNYPGERELYEDQVFPRLSELDERIEELRSVVASGHEDEQGVATALGAVGAAATSLDEGLASLAELNHRYAFAAASQIVTARARSARLMLGLEVASAIVAIVATAVAVTGASRFAQRYRMLLERESDRAGELELLAQRVAHDLLSPLSAVALSLGTVVRAQADPHTAHAVDRANRALARCREMVRGIYAFSKSGARPTPDAVAPLRETVLDTVDGLLAAEGKSPPTVCVQIPEDVDVAMDRPVLGTVLSNLLSNAFKYTREAPVRQITVRTVAAPQEVRVEVEDTGPGIPQGLEEAIFEPYRRGPGVTQPGLGLGLATVKRLVLAHGGKLGAHAGPSGGAVFWVDLPRAVSHA